MDAQEVDHLQLFNHSLSAIQSFIADGSSVSNTSDSYSDSNDSICVKFRNKLPHAYRKQDFMQILVSLPVVKVIFVLQMQIGHYSQC